MTKPHSTADSDTTRHKAQHLEVSCLQQDETEVWRPYIWRSMEAYGIKKSDMIK